jgi:hypothetical protein
MRCAALALIEQGRDRADRLQGVFVAPLGGRLGAALNGNPGGEVGIVPRSVVDFLSGRTR